MRCERLRLSCRALERRHIGHCTVMWVRRDVGVGDIEWAHGNTSDYFDLIVAHPACVFQTMIFPVTRTCAAPAVQPVVAGAHQSGRDLPERAALLSFLLCE